MREILFRAKRTDNGMWVEGLYIETPLTAEVITPIEDGHYFLTGNKRHCISHDGCVHEIHRESLGAFTGLTDKSGRKAFEGDKFWDDNHEKAFTIEWDDKLAAWMANYDSEEQELLANIWNKCTIALN